MVSNQTLLILISLVILTMLILLVNSTLLQNTALKLENNSALGTISLAESLIEEIKTKAFDESTILEFVSDRNSLTASSSLGTEGETYPYFDDADDYQNYSRTITTSDAGDVTAVVNIYYLDENNPNNITSNKTYLKRISITLSGSNLNHDININYIVSSW